MSPCWTFLCAWTSVCTMFLKKGILLPSSRCRKCWTKITSVPSCSSNLAACQHSCSSNVVWLALTCPDLSRVASSVSFLADELPLCQHRKCKVWYTFGKFSFSIFPSAGGRARACSGGLISKVFLFFLCGANPESTQSRANLLHYVLLECVSIRYSSYQGHALVNAPW